jgi:hypothetical protein
MLSYEDQRKIFDEVDKKFKEREERLDRERLEELAKKGIVPPDPNTFPKKYCDHPNTMENSTATFFYIIAMLVGSIFKGNWIIWIIATVVWAKFITRHDK